MAFFIHSTDDGRAPVTEYLPVGAITPKAGMTLTVTNGKLEIAAAKAEPSYISLCERESECVSGELIPVMRVQPDIVFETTFSADAAEINLGDKVTIATGGMQVTATAGGAAEIVRIQGKAVGDPVLVRFVTPDAGE